MPKADISDHLRRVWRLLDILPPRGEGKTKAQLNEELAHEFNVTVKTTERDLQFLEQEGFAIKGTRDFHDGTKPKQVWEQVPEKSLNLVRTLRTDGALALHLIDQMAEKLLPPEVNSALAMVRTKAKERLRERRNSEQKAMWAEKVQIVPEGFALQAPALNGADILPNLQTALLRDRQVHGQYQKLGAETAKEVVLEPRGLWQSGNLLYVVMTDPAKPLGKDPYKHYRLDRFLSLEVTELPIRALPSFRLKEFLSEGGAQFAYGKAPLRFRARAEKNVWKRLGETKLAANQQLTPIRGTTQQLIEADVVPSEHFMMWLLSHGPEIEVLEPASLREEMGAKLRKAAAAYEAPAATVASVSAAAEKL